MRRVSIASASQLAANAGSVVADAGGNAVDAAIGAVICSMVTDPGIIAPGGGGFVTVWPANDDPVVIDAYAEMPGRGLPPERFGKGGREIVMTYGGRTSTIVGYGSIATPGMFAGLRLAWERYGKAPWKELFDPAILAVEAGFPLSSAAAEYLGHSHDVIFGWDPNSSSVLHKENGRHLSTGDLVLIPDLADTLRLLAAEGVSPLYGGELGARIVATVEGNGGILTLRDLSEYQAIVRQPITVEVDDWTIATNAPPAVGGATMAAMLLLMGIKGFDEWEAADVARLVEVQEAVLTFRRTRLDELHDRSAEAARLLELASMGDMKGLLASPSTSHSSTVDSDGLGCSITVSAGYGSGAMVTSTGMWLNNSLGEMELHPGGFHGINPGMRLVSNMAPTVARSRHGAVLAIGSPGADRITTAVSSVLVNFMHLGMSLSEAVEHARLHTEVFGGVPTVSYEPGINVPDIEGFDFRRFPDRSMYFGGVQASLWDPLAGFFEVADRRRSGGVAHGG
ncbi:MAG: gamma-glutamyltransferase [Actinomycetota bacterium]|nr:gamma-glutamyltransferase [Actinomycetota bacterium]